MTSQVLDLAKFVRSLNSQFKAYMASSDAIVVNKKTPTNKNLGIFFGPKFNRFFFFGNKNIEYGEVSKIWNNLNLYEDIDTQVLLNPITNRTELDRERVLKCLVLSSQKLIMYSRTEDFVLLHSTMTIPLFRLSKNKKLKTDLNSFKDKSKKLLKQITNQSSQLEKDIRWLKWRWLIGSSSHLMYLSQEYSTSIKKTFLTSFTKSTKKWIRDHYKVDKQVESSSFFRNIIDFHRFDMGFIKRESLYTKLKYSRSPAYDIVSGGAAAFLAEFIGFLVSEKFGIELVDSGDFYIAFMFGVFLGLSLKPLMRILSAPKKLTNTIVSAYKSVFIKPFSILTVYLGHDNFKNILVILLGIRYRGWSIKMTIMFVFLFIYQLFSIPFFFL